MKPVGRLPAGRRHRWLLAALAPVLLPLLACSDDDGASDETTSTTVAPTSTTASTTTTTAPPLPSSTTTTMFDPSTVEGEVEAAYLRSWDVYAEAVYTLELDEAALAEALGDPYLAVVRDEVVARIAEGRAAEVRVDHNYSIDVIDEQTASVIDAYVNHQVLIDPETKEPIEDDPNEVITDVATLRRDEAGWRVTEVHRVR